MYIREIPVELRQEIKEIVQRNKGNVIRFGHLDLLKLFKYYYRYVGTLRSGLTIDQMVMKEIQCGKCVGTIQRYFINEVSKW
jgi:hypothetical protein